MKIFTRFLQNCRIFLLQGKADLQKLEKGENKNVCLAVVERCLAHTKKILSLISTLPRSTSKILPLRMRDGSKK
jgi:hypothetical protein